MFLLPITDLWCLKENTYEKEVTVLPLYGSKMFMYNYLVFKGNAPFLSVLIITFVGSNDYFIPLFFDVSFYLELFEGSY